MASYSLEDKIKEPNVAYYSQVFVHLLQQFFLLQSHCVKEFKLVAPRDFSKFFLKILFDHFFYDSQASHFSAVVTHKINYPWFYCWATVQHRMF